MKRIHQLNYETYALDYLEGNLAPEEQQAFEAFLERHPALANELQEVDELQLTPPRIQYPHKRSLYRQSHNGWAWGIAAGWALIISLTALWWLLPAPQTSAPAMAVIPDPTPPSYSIDRVPVSSLLAELKAAPYALEPLRPAYRAVPEPLNMKDTPSEMITASYPDSASQQPTLAAVATLPLMEQAFLQPEVTIIFNQRAQWSGGPSTRGEPKAGGILDADKIPLLDPLTQILPEEQKNWVANWRPVESIKEEIHRDRWTDALTPEFLQSKKPTK